MTPDTLRGMRDEIEKSAAPMGAVTRAARWLTESPVRGAIIGGAAGAAHGATKEEGGGMGGAIRGGIRGAAIGGAAAGAGRAYRDTRLLDPSLTAGQAVGGTLKRLGGGIKRFGQRQLHGFTGYGKSRPGDIGLRSSATAQKKIDLRAARLQDRIEHGAVSVDDIDKFHVDVAKMRREGRLGDESLAAGVTSIPGVVKGLATSPLRTGKALWKDTVGGGGTAGAALAIGLPVAASAPDIARGDESAVGGRSMKQKMVGLGTGLAGGVATAGMPVLPQLVAGIGIDEAGQRLARRQIRRRSDA